MGVPDEIDGPVRKRPRLSLRHKPDQSKSSSGAPNVEMTTESMTGTNQSSYALVKTLDLPSECIDLPADLPSSQDPLVAPVASLHNLGNTCFLNSMLEVLRYTPGFLDGLHKLQEEILLEETECDTQNSESDNSERRYAWKIVKNTCAMFTEMDKKEEQYREIATADASSMAVRPSALLDNIRELNPMFEGHFQHDAQELLRCLLCYIEDAEKELTQLRDRGVKREDVERISEAVLATEEDEKVDTGVTEKRTLAHTFCTSLKGGESHDRSKVTENDRLRQQDMTQDVSVKNVMKFERNASSSTMVLYDQDKLRYGSSGGVETDDQITSVKLENEEVELVGFSGLSSGQISKARKRRRSKSKSTSGNRVKGSSGDVATASTVRTRGLRRKTDNDTCSKSVGVHGETAGIVSGSADQLAADCYSHKDCLQNLQTKATVSPNCAMLPEPSSISSAANKCETESASSRILSFQPLNPIKRLGMRGRALISSICQMGDQLLHGDNSNSNVGDVNNNTGSCNSYNSRSVCAAVDNNIHVDVLEIPDSDHQAASTSCINKMSPCKMVLKSPVKSPVEHTDEISVISEGDTSRANTHLNTVTKKYISSVSRSSTSSHIVPSLTSRPGPSTESGLGAESAMDVLPLHVLEPNKEINVTVQVSPKKKPSVSELNRKPGLCVPLDKASDERLPLSSEDTSKCPISLADTYPSGVESNKDSDSVLCTFLNVNDVSAHEGKSQFPETLQTSDDLTAPCMTVTSPRDILSRQVPCAKTYSVCGTQDLKQTDKSPHKWSISFQSQNIAAQRSPGANIPDDASTLQPKLELRKCDWLGVSPIKSVSAMEAMSILSQKSIGLESLTARRKILYDDTDSFLHSQSIFNGDVNRLPIEQSQDISCRDHTEVTVTTTAENEGKKWRSKGSLLAPSRKSSRTSQAKKFRKNIPCSSNKMLKTCQRFSPSQDIPLKPLSVTLDRCDWLLQAAHGLPVSAKQALMDIKKGSIMTSQHLKSQTGMADMLKQCQVQKSDLSVSGIRPQTSPGTLVESLFGGTMMHQTKCLECEVARHRQEVFMDISVPVRSLHNDNSDDDSDDDSSNNRNKSGVSCLSKLMRSCTSVERLIDANKYFCEQCMHHVEAERSCHYLTLPSVLTLHLKRFSANSKLYGHVSKLNDKIAIPQTLPCLHYQCKSQCSNSSHTFSLFAIVTHSGSSILHGHYRAYVKVQSHVNPSVFRKLLKSKVKTEEDQLVETNMETSPNTDSLKDEPHWTTEQGGYTSTRCYDGDDDLFICDETLHVTASKGSLVSKSKYLGNDIDDVRTTQLKSHSDERKFDPSPTDEGKSESLSGSTEYDSFWLECDDECIKVMEEHEFIEKLEEKDGCLIGTPYVLFYHKLLT